MKTLAVFAAILALTMARSADPVPKPEAPISKPVVHSQVITLPSIENPIIRFHINIRGEYERIPARVARSAISDWLENIRGKLPNFRPGKPAPEAVELLPEIETPIEHLPEVPPRFRPENPLPKWHVPGQPRPESPLPEIPPPRPENPILPEVPEHGHRPIPRPGLPPKIKLPKGQLPEIPPHKIRPLPPHGGPQLPQDVAHNPEQFVWYFPNQEEQFVKVRVVVNDFQIFETLPENLPELIPVLLARFDNPNPIVPPVLPMPMPDPDVPAIEVYVNVGFPSHYE